MESRNLGELEGEIAASTTIVHMKEARASAVFIPPATEYNKTLQSMRPDDGKNLHDTIPLGPVSQDSDFGVIPIQDLQIMKLIGVPFQK